jgi:hypothetical protein
VETDDLKKKNKEIYLILEDKKLEERLIKNKSDDDKKRLEKELKKFNC